MKDHEKKLELHNNYKNHRNLLSTLIKQSKHKYFNKYFEDNWHNMKNTCKVIKYIITLNNLSSDVPRTLSVNDVSISDPCNIANTFNNYFRSNAKKKDNINYSHKHYSDYLSDKCKNSFFIYPTDKDEIADIISSLDKNKSVGPYSIPNNILILLKNEISNSLADLFNLSFSSGKFPSVLKIAKVVPVYKKDSKLDYQNYRPIISLSNIEKILEKLMYKRLYKFLNDNNVLYDLQFGFRQNFSTTMH